MTLDTRDVGVAAYLGWRLSDLKEFEGSRVGWIAESMDSQRSYRSLILYFTFLTEGEAAELTIVAKSLRLQGCLASSTESLFFNNSLSQRTSWMKCLCHNDVISTFAFI